MNRKQTTNEQNKTGMTTIASARITVDRTPERSKISTDQLGRHLFTVSTTTYVRSMAIWAARAHVGDEGQVNNNKCGQQCFKPHINRKLALIGRTAGAANNASIKILYYCLSQTLRLI